MMPSEPYVLPASRGNIEIQSFWQLCVAAVIMVPLPTIRPYLGPACCVHNILLALFTTREYANTIASRAVSLSVRTRLASISF